MIEKLTFEGESVTGYLDALNLSDKERQKREIELVYLYQIVHMQYPKEFNDDINDRVNKLLTTK